MKWIIRHKIQLPIIATVVALLTVNVSCSGPNYARMDNSGWFSIDYPKGFEYSISPIDALSLGNTPEVEFIQQEPVTVPGKTTSTLVTMSSISVFGVNGAYSDVVDYNNTVAPMLKGKLVQKGSVSSVFQWTDDLFGQVIYIDYDIGNRRTVAILGTTKGTSKSALNTLTRYCTDMAKSLKPSSDWVSDGTGK